MALPSKGISLLPKLKAGTREAHILFQNEGGFSSPGTFVQLVQHT